MRRSTKAEVGLRRNTGKNVRRVWTTWLW